MHPTGLQRSYPSMAHRPALEATRQLTSRDSSETLRGGRCKSSTRTMHSQHLVPNATPSRLLKASQLQLQRPRGCRLARHERRHKRKGLSRSRPREMRWPWHRRHGARAKGQCQDKLILQLSAPPRDQILVALSALGIDCLREATRTVSLLLLSRPTQRRKARSRSLNPTRGTSLPARCLVRVQLMPAADLSASKTALERNMPTLHSSRTNKAVLHLHRLDTEGAARSVAWQTRF